MTDQVREILKWYAGQNPGTLTNLARILNHGKLGGTGKLVILPVDQGFEHGPARSFAKNPDGYDPRYHYRLAIESGCNAYAAPLGALEAGAAEFAGEIPLILKVNNNELLSGSTDPCPAITASVDDALRLGCCAIGYTMYPGSPLFRAMYENLHQLAEEAKSAGLAVVVWSYPRGGKLEKEDETSLNVIAYAAHLACQLGAHIVKVKFPAAHISALDKETYKIYDEIINQHVKVANPIDRIRHVTTAAFNGRRIVIFSGGPAKGDDKVFEEIKAIRDGGGFGSIIGRNSFQRPWNKAIEFLGTVMDLYLGKNVERGGENA
jgi:fructose-bisphosphate aldolase, class I